MIDVEGYDIVRVILDATEDWVCRLCTTSSQVTVSMMTLPMGARCTMDTADKSIVFHDGKIINF